MTKISMDIKQMPANKGYSHILVLLCEVTNYMVALPLMSTRTPHILHAFQKGYLAYFGPPTHIICDQDPAFTSSLMEAFVTQLNIKIVLVSPTNHQSLQAEHGIKSLLHARKVATEIERQLKENRRLQAEKARQLQIEKDIKEKEAKRRALEKAKIAALIDKHRSCTPSTPDEVNKSGTGINANTNEKGGTEKAQPSYKKATKASQIKSSQNKGTKPDKDRPDALLGDPIVNTKKNTKKTKAIG